jgi:hypothetical protein
MVEKIGCNLAKRASESDIQIWGMVLEKAFIRIVGGRLCDAFNKDIDRQK